MVGLGDDQDPELYGDGPPLACFPNTYANAAIVAGHVIGLTSAIPQVHLTRYRPQLPVWGQLPESMRWHRYATVPPSIPDFEARIPATIGVVERRNLIARLESLRREAGGANVLVHHEDDRNAALNVIDDGFASGRSMVRVHAVILDPPGLERPKRPTIVLVGTKLDQPGPHGAAVPSYGLLATISTAGKPGPVYLYASAFYQLVEAILDAHPEICNGATDLLWSLLPEQVDIVEAWVPHRVNLRVERFGFPAPPDPRYRRERIGSDIGGRR